MTLIPNAYNKVPMMFRAQIPGRSQLQYLENQDAERWTDEWIDKAEFISEEKAEDITTETYQTKS